MGYKYIRLEILDLNKDEDKFVYEDITSSEFPNPYYYVDYLLQHQTEIKKLIAFVLKEKDAVLGLMPMIVNQIPGTKYFDAISPYGYNGPLFKKNIDASTVATFWQKVDSWYEENNFVTEFIRFSLTNNQVGYSGDLLPTLINVCGHLQNDFEAQWSIFGKKVRNNYRRAQSFNLTFKMFDAKNLSKEVVDNFYAIYHKTMIRNKASKFLFFSNGFFQKLVLDNKEDFTISIVYHDNISVSTELHIHYNDSVYAFLGGTDSDYFQTRPNDFLRVEVIKWAIANKKKKYILGGGIKNDDGLYKSKKAFFPKDEDCTFYTGRKVINEEIYNDLVEQAINERGIDQDESYFPLYRKP